MVGGILELKLQDARGLKKTDLLSRIDPYVIIKFRSEQRKSKTIAEGGSNPVWNETFRFNVQYPSKVDNQYKLTLKLMDRDLLTKDDFLGEATIYLQGVIAEGMENGFAEQRNYKSRVVLADGRYHGEIRVSATFNRKNDTQEEGHFGGWTQSYRH